MGDQEHATRTASARLRVLQREFTTRPVRPAEPGPRATRVHAPVPIDLGVLGHLEATVHEVNRFIEQNGRPPSTPSGGPAPDRPDVYDRLEAATRHLSGRQAAQRDAMVMRQSLEHALAAGNEVPIRRIPCPKCGCASLYWWAAHRRVACMYTRCSGKRRPTLWTLAQLVDAQVGKMLKTAAT